MRQVLAILVAIATAAIIQGLFYTYRFLVEKKRDELRRRLQSDTAVDSAQLNLLRRGRLARSARLAAFLRGFSAAERMELFLQQAQIPVTVAQLLTYSVVLALFGGQSLDGAPQRLGPIDRGHRCYLGRR